MKSGTLRVQSELLRDGGFLIYVIKNTYKGFLEILALNAWNLDFSHNLRADGLTHYKFGIFDLNLLSDFGLVVVD